LPPIDREEITEMAGNPSSQFPSGLCTGTCTWKINLGNWFPTSGPVGETTTGCNCAFLFNDGTRTIDARKEGLDAPAKRKIELKFPGVLKLTKQDAKGNPLEFTLPCVPNGQVVDIS
jgi:hypothetical protein